MWTGTTLASFQSLGRDVSCSYLLKNLHKEGAITEAVSLSNLAGISSGPVALPTSSALSTARTVDSLRVRSDIIVSERMHAVFSSALSIVNTEAKNLLNRSAILGGVSARTIERFCDWSAEESETWPGMG